MRSILIGALLITGALQAKKLDVVVHTVPGLTITVRGCGCDGSFDGIYERGIDALRSHTYPGSIALDIAGGVAPYQVIWHEMPDAPFSHVSVMPGTYTVTVEDAIGDHLTRTVQVSSIQSFQGRSCLPKPEKKKKVMVQPCEEEKKPEQAEKPKPSPDRHVGRHPWTDREVTDRGDRQRQGPEVSGDPNGGVGRSAPVERHDNGNDRIGSNRGTGGEHNPGTTRPLGR